MDSTTTALVARLQHVDTTSLVDAAPGLHVLPPGIRPVRPGARLVGPAVTVDACEDLVPVLVGLRSAGPGDVLLVASNPGRALAGELFATEAQRRGLAGIVLYGLCRDSRTLRSIDLPVFALGVDPRAYGARRAPAHDTAAHDEPLRIGDVFVRDGDLVVADDDGVVVGSVEELAGAIDAAEAIQRREEALRVAIEAGDSLFDHLNLDEHLDALRAGRDSRLTFS